MKCLFKKVEVRHAAANRNWWGQVEQSACEDYRIRLWDGSPFIFVDYDFELEFDEHSYSISYEVPAVLPIIAGDEHQRDVARRLLSSWRVPEWA